MTWPLVGPLLDNKILILILILYMLLFWEITNKICVFIYAVRNLYYIPLNLSMKLFLWYPSTRGGYGV